MTATRVRGAPLYIYGNGLAMKYLLYALLCLSLYPVCSNAETPKPEYMPGPVKPRVVQSFGCLLPLSGEYRLLGEKVLRGALLAAESMTAGAEYRVTVKDIGGEALDSAVDEMAAAGDISFVVGPLPSKFINGVKPLVNSRNVPALVFPVADDEGEGGPNFIKFYYSLEDQVRTLSEYAVNELGVRKFAILYPATGYGRKMKDIFTETANGSGARVVYEASYGPDTSGVTGELKWIAAAGPDALFIPDGGAASAKIILALMHATDMREVLFVGPSTWNSPLFLNLVGKEIDGFVYRAIFTDYFFYGSREWRDFAAAFEAKFNQTPGSLEYQAYTAVRLILSVTGGKKMSTARIVGAIERQYGKSGFEITREASGSYRVSAGFKILSVESGELSEVMRVHPR